ncbi:MAG TPA: DNA repair protein RecO [Pseudohongiella sp.]|nr:DNA repair protein RecO [Pseudohongiella sp.]
MRVTIDLQPAYVLHTRDYRDTSLLVDLLTLDYGVIRAVARGVRGARRNSKRALLQPLQPLLVSLAGHGELLNLNHVEASAAVLQIRGERLFSVMYLNEILCRLLPAQESHPELYRLYQSALLALLQDCELEAVLRRFEFSLLTELGYVPDMRTDAVDTLPLSVSGWYQFDPEQGFVPAVIAAGMDVSTDASLFSGTDILALADALPQPFDAAFARDQLQVAKRLMRQALRPLLGPRPLNSRKLFLAMNGARRSLPTPGSQ